jgi:hypothetical protein
MDTVNPHSLYPGILLSNPGGDRLSRGQLLIVHAQGLLVIVHDIINEDHLIPHYWYFNLSR